MSGDLLELAVDVARDAGALLRARASVARTVVETKSSDTDMVTDADREAEEVVIRAISGARPNDAIVGEEGGGAEGSSGLTWIVDPLDGTTNFLYGVPHYSVSVACVDEEGVLAGAVYDPSRDEMFAARRGGGATLNGHAISVRRGAALATALCATGFSYDAAERATQAQIAASMLPVVRDLRRGGSAALDLAWVACGRLDAYAEMGVAPWDVAGGRIVVAEAGGIVSELPPLRGSANPFGILAASPDVHPDLLALLRTVHPSMA